MLAEVRVWQSVRKPSEIMEHMMQEDPKNPDLLAYWKMNSADGEKVILPTASALLITS